MTPLAFDHPWALAALAVPLALLILARRARAPREPSAVLRLWRDAGARPPRELQRAHRAVPPAIWLAALSLVFGILALSAPRSRAQTAVRTTHCLVDTSPSMYLPWSSGESFAGAPTRLERSLQLAQRWLAEHRGEVDRLEWTRWIDARFESVVGDAPPQEWLRAPRADAAPPPFAEVDREGWMWLTDRAPRPLPKQAGYCASGGAAVPGPVAEDEQGVLVWNGRELVRSQSVSASLAVDAGVAEPIAELARTWSTARGVVDGGDGERVLELRVAHGAPQAERERAGRDGWWCEGAPIAAELERGEQAWLFDARGRVLVAWSKGRVRVAWSSLGEPAGDPAAFAISWSELFDAARATRAGIVPLSERADAGAPAQQEPARIDDGLELDRRGASYASSVLAALAVAAALAALGFAARSPFTSPASSPAASAIRSAPSND